MLLSDMVKGAIIGFTAGLAVAIGGAIKDAPMEGFKPFTFIRSPIIGMIEGTVIQLVAKPALPITFLATIGTERITVESWKLIRGSVPGKFKNGEWGKVRPTIQTRNYNKF